MSARGRSRAVVPVPRRNASRALSVEVKKPERSLTEREKLQVKRMIGMNEELKYVVPYLTYAASTSTPIVTGLTDIVQGLGDSQRAGDRVKLCGTLELRGSCRADIGTGDTTQSEIYIRTCLFQWHPTSNNGGATEPTAGNVFLNGPSGAPDVYSFYNHDQRQNFVILYDEVHTLTGISAGAVLTTTANSGMIQYFHRKIPLAKKIRAQMQFQAASSTDATNHIYMVSMSNLAADAQNPQLLWSCKFFFRDA